MATPTFSRSVKRALLFRAFPLILTRSVHVLSFHKRSLEDKADYFRVSNICVYGIDGPPWVLIKDVFNISTKIGPNRNI